MCQKTSEAIKGNVFGKNSSFSVSSFKDDIESKVKGVKKQHISIKVKSFLVVPTYLNDLELDFELFYPRFYQEEGQF